MTIAPERPRERVMNTTPRPKFEDELKLAALPTAVSCAQMLVRSDLQRWGIASGHIETAARLASGLVTNAVETTGITGPHPRYGPEYKLKLVVIRLRLFAQSLVIEVWDSSDEAPGLEPPSLDAERGSGLFVVQSLSRQWNYYFPKNGGKVIWCELDISRPLHDDTVKLPPVLPKRQRTTGPTQPTEVMNDPELLRRVLDGLRALRSDNEQEP